MRRILLLLLATLLLAGCGHSRTPDFYVLESGANPIAADRLPVKSMALTDVAVPDYLDCRSIVLRDGNGNLQLMPQFNTWAEPLSKGTARVLRQILAKPLLGAGVTMTAGSDSHVLPSYALHVDIVRLEASTNGHVVLEMQWALTNADAAVLGRGSLAAQETITMPAFGSRDMFRAVVACESRLLQQCGSRLAAVLPQLVRGK